VLGLGLVVAAFLSAPTFAVRILEFLNAKPAWREDDAAAEGGAGERQERDALPRRGLRPGVRF